MTIIAYTGLPGHGKSYSVVENVVIPALKQGRVVAHNLELNLAALAIVCEREVESLLLQIPKDDTSPDRLVTLCPFGAVIVIDEVWRYWGAGLKASEVPRDQVAFFKEHRHRVGPDGRATEIVVIDQELGSGVARFIRDLVEITFIHQKLSAVGASGRYTVDVYTRAQNAGAPKKSNHIRKMIGKYKPEVWNCYNSHTQKTDGIGEAGLEQVADDRGNIFKSGSVKSAIALLVLSPLLVFFAYRSISNLTGDKHKTPIASIPVKTVTTFVDTDGSKTVTVSTPQPPPQTITEKPSRTPSVNWRLVGVVYREEGPAKGAGYALLISATGRRQLDLKTFCEPTPQEAGDYTCNLDGEWVTRWSGTNMGGFGPPKLVEGAAPIAMPTPEPART